VTLGISIDIILPASLWPWSAVRRIDSLTTCTCRLSGILGPSASCNP